MIKETISPRLRKMVDDTRLEIHDACAKHGLGRIKRMVKDAPPVVSFFNALRSGRGLIAEVKVRSPSQGFMNRIRLDEAIPAYRESKAVKAVSILTNETYFGGKGITTLGKARRLIDKPILRKDFIFEEYQVFEARAHGADAILLMANILSKEGLLRLSNITQELGMDVLFETHKEEELDDLPPTAKIVGINCRNFEAGPLTFRRFGLARFFRQWLWHKDLSVDMKRFSYCKKIADDKIRVAESGVSPGTCRAVFEEGFQTILAGTCFLLSSIPVAEALGKFETAIKDVNERFQTAPKPILRPAAA